MPLLSQHARVRGAGARALLLVAMCVAVSLAAGGVSPARKAKGTYKGDTNNKGEPDGHGTMEYGKHGRHIGQWLAGKRHGPGMLVVDGKVRFIGMFEDDAMTGHGMVVRSNGEQHIGHYAKDIRNGHGQSVYPSGDCAALPAAAATCRALPARSTSTSTRGVHAC